MKFLLTITLVWSSVCYSQCYNVFGKKIICPDFDDSLVLYNNAVKVNDYFENNRIYTKTRSRTLTDNLDKKDIYVTLQKARSLFFIIRKDSSLNNENDPEYIRPKPGYQDISYEQYYQEIDEFRFYQRELENQIINEESPMPMYDNRICPIVVNEYKCIDTSSIFYGDIVNIPMYIPIVVKPVSLLSPRELVMRQEILHPEYNKISDEKGFLVSNEEKNERNVKKEITVPKKGLPVYMYNDYGSASIIGFMDKRDFIRLKPEEYEEYVVQEFARDLLGNENKLEKWLKIRYGEYYSIFK